MSHVLGEDLIYEVLSVVEEIPEGKVASYGQIARLDVGKVDNPLRFQGQYFDAESGLHYNRHRYYNPDIGRYLTPDPVKLAGGVNAYRYAPNPTGWIDPLGLYSLFRAVFEGEYNDIISTGKFNLYWKYKLES